MVDYDRLLDAPTRAFIARTDSFYPPETASFPIDRQREIYDAMCAAFRQPRPPGLPVADRGIGGVPCRVYGDVGAARVVYFHGGGWVVGGLDSHDDICAEIAQRTGFQAIAVDYRLSPEHRHPAAFDDALAVLRAVAAEGLPVVLAGDSAGGNIAAAVAQAVRAEALPLAGMVLIYPGLGGAPRGGSYDTHAKAPMLTLDDVLYYKDIRKAAGQVLDDDATASPLADPDLSGLPPALIVTAECDPLADDGRAYRDRIVAAGGQARLIEEKGLVHGYLRARHSVPRAGASFDRIVEGIARLGRGEGLQEGG